MTQLPNPLKKHVLWRSSRGRADLQIVGLMIGALVSVVLIFFAAKALIGGSESGSATTDNPDQILPESGSAPIQTIEEVLASVQVYVSSEEFGPATAILKGAIGRYPTDPDLRFALGDLYMMTKEYPLAYEQYVAAIEHNRSEGSGIDSKSQFTAGTLANTIGQPELAKVHYKLAMEGDPQNADYPLYLANIQFKLNELDAAKASLAIAGRLAPDRAMVWATWAKIALRQNNLPIAIQQIQKVRKLEPRVVDWIVLEANIRKRDGNPERAIELLSALPDDSLDDPESIRLLAESYGMIGRPGDAASRMVDYANRHSDNAQAAFDAAVWLERAKERGDAVLWGRRARDLGHPRAQGWLDSLPD